MRIQHNISALNASNRLAANDNAISKNLQKLSSGYRINSAADDAAGLAVSEKMRAQISGLNQAENNAQNGISLVQTAEGGLNETEAILQRMNTLAVESATGTYDDADRANLQKEVQALKSEIDRISTATNFNGIALLDGSLDTYNVTLAGDGLTNAGVTISGGNLAKDDKLTVAISSTAGNIVVSDGTGSPIADVTYATVAAATSSSAYTVTLSYTGTDADLKAKYDGLTVTVTTDGSYAVPAADDSEVYTVESSKAISFQIGSENKTDQRVSLAVGDMGAEGLGIQDVDISHQEDARTAIETIKSAIATVSTTRADLGALQNRLEHTSNNLTTMSENLTSAESTIRDVDMSAEMVDLTKNQILEQAATSMLAQANAQPQSVLTLLRG